MGDRVATNPMEKYRKIDVVGKGNFGCAVLV